MTHFSLTLLRDMTWPNCVQLFRPSLHGQHFKNNGNNTLSVQAAQCLRKDIWARRHLKMIIKQINVSLKEKKKKKLKLLTSDWYRQPTPKPQISVNLFDHSPNPLKIEILLSFFHPKSSSVKWIFYRNRSENMKISINFLHLSVFFSKTFLIHNLF